MAIRNGRFTFKALPATLDRLIVLCTDKGRGGAFYRVLNSGAVSFTVQYGEFSTPGDFKEAILEKDQSFDVYVDDGMKIKVKASAANDQIEGIYDFLGDMEARHLEPVRSGRFMGNDLRKVADFTGNKDCVAFYRFLNSGENNITISTGSSLLTEAAGLAPRMSIDVTPKAGQDLTIAPTTQSEQIEGIYDFLSGSEK